MLLLPGSRTTLGGDSVLLTASLPHRTRFEAQAHSPKNGSPRVFEPSADRRPGDPSRNMAALGPANAHIFSAAPLSSVSGSLRG